jgi:membrane-bound inhibitor of C-type lysozyme
MNISTKVWVSLVIGFAALLLIVVVFVRTPAPAPSDTLLAKVNYVCDSGKKITASFFQGVSTTTPVTGQAPTPTGSVALVLDDGRTMSLPQTISADGARYANAGESTIFWSKGKGLLFTEGGLTTYGGCLQVADNPGGLDSVYENGTKGFSLRYPTGFTVDSAYSYQALGPGKAIGGVKFTIPGTMATGTNLSVDSYVSVEQLANQSVCSAATFLGSGVKALQVTDGDMTYSMATSTDAAAGNRYEETVYALPGTSPCIAVRYFVHYGAIENYTPGAVASFDRVALLKQFDAIRQTLIIGQ